MNFKQTYELIKDTIENPEYLVKRSFIVMKSIAEPNLNQFNIALDMNDINCSADEWSDRNYKNIHFWKRNGLFKTKYYMEFSCNEPLNISKEECESVVKLLTDNNLSHILSDWQ